MRRSIFALVLAGLLAAAGTATAQDPIPLGAVLRSTEEVPAIMSFATGSFRATLNEDQTELSWELDYSGLSAEITQAHIHFAQRGVNGAIMVFLCSNLGNGPADTQACPEAGSVSGTITAADIVSNADDQGIPAGNFFRFQRALRQGVAYANIHTTRYTGGEIRGQVAVVSP